jgi:FixJ family two-component response regulator
LGDGISGALRQKKEEMMADGVLIMIVEDDESMRKAIKRLIKSVGLSVEDFASAEDFLGSDRSPDAACLILDVRLPGMNGLELQRQLVTSNRRIPIIFISAHSDQPARAQALAAGAVGLLQKPFSEKDLFMAINSALVDQRVSVGDAFDRGRYQITRRCDTPIPKLRW